MFKLGITGTRSGMNATQQTNCYEFLKAFDNFRFEKELHHGDCVGVDVEIAAMARKLKWRIVCHPPIDHALRAYFPSDEYRTPLTYFARNRKIVEETGALLVVPFQNEHQTNGGTWYTHDYGKKLVKAVLVYYPNGEKDYSSFNTQN